MIKVGNHYFELIESYKDGFNEDDFIVNCDTTFKHLS